MAVGLMLAAHGFAAETSITLHQGANIAVTAPTAFDRIAFDLAGTIWVLDDANESANALTGSGALHQRPAFSRDGRLIAHESIQAGYRQIFVTDTSSGASRQVTFGPYDHLAPAWSPADAAQLVVSSNRGGNFDIWVVDVDNLDLRQLTFTAADERDPAWNDDGSRLAYVAESARGWSLYVLTPGAKPQRVLQESEPIAAPTWRPGGGLLTYVRRSNQSNQLRMLILSTPPISKPITRRERVSPRAVHWIDRTDFLYAADGKIRRRTLGLPTFDDIPFSVTIAVNRNERSARPAAVAGLDNRPVRGLNGSTERADGRYVAAALGDLWEFQRQADDKLLLVRQLTNDAYVDAQPAFSPAGQRLAFVSDRSGSPQIWVMDPVSLDAQRLTRDDDIVGRPQWSPDGATVAYLVSDDAHGYRLHEVDVTSRQSRPLTAISRDRGKPIPTNGSWEIHDDPTARRGSLSAEISQSVPLTWRPAAGNQRYIVRAGRIFDGIGPEYLLRHEIVIEADLIVAIRPWSISESNAEPNTPIIDATAHTVIPGLIDLAVQQTPINDERNGRKWLAAGVTTIRQTVTDFDLAIEQLESWSSGRRIGPRLMLTVRPCDAESGQFEEQLFGQMLARTAALNIVAMELCTELTGEVLTDVIRRAHEHGLSVIATMPGRAIGADELRSPVLSSTGEPQQRLPAWRDALLVMGMTGTAIPSRFVTGSGHGDLIFNGLRSSWQYRKIFTVAERRYFDTSPYFGWASDRRAQDVDANQILGAGGRILVGSHAPLTPQGLGLHAEMRLLVASGIQPFQVLKMTSLDAARTLGNGESLGMVRVGRLADLVILDGDPLADIAAATRVVGTVVNGRYFSRRDLTTKGLRGSGYIPNTRAGVERNVGKLYNSERR